MKKQSKKSYEKSSADRKADKAGKHGKEGSKKDKVMDARLFEKRAKKSMKGKRGK